MKSLKITLATLAVALTSIMAPGIASAAVFLGTNGLWYGNICQASMGWQVVPWALVGSTCYSPTFGYGYIANY